MQPLYLITFRVEDSLFRKICRVQQEQDVFYNNKNPKLTLIGDAEINARLQCETKVIQDSILAAAPPSTINDDDNFTGVSRDYNKKWLNYGKSGIKIYENAYYQQPCISIHYALMRYTVGRIKYDVTAVKT